MKKFFLKMLPVFLVVAVSVGFASCGPDDPEPPSAELTVSPTSPSAVKGEGGVLSFQVSSNIDWLISNNENWIQLSMREGNGNASVTATISANGTSASRSAIITFSDKGGKVSPVSVVINQESGGIALSPSTISLLGAAGSTANLSIKTIGNWTLSSSPDWLHSSATSGEGNTNIILTALSANDMTDEPRTAKLTFTSGKATASVTVSQESTLPKGLRVETSNMTIMSDGFACDLKFGKNTKGYREAFFTEDEVRTMTDKDIYNKLMEKTENSGTLDFTFLPGWANPNTNLVYCIAAYGNETNGDGSHKYGPMTIVHVTTKAETIFDDMYLTFTYNSSRWNVNASRSGSYGQRCDEFYYVAAEDDVAELYNTFASGVTYAFLAHFVFKPSIAKDKNWNYCNGPQNLTWTRTGDKFFCATWGIDRDTKKYSSELSWLYRDLSASASANGLKSRTPNPSEWNKQTRRPTQAEVDRMRNSLQVIRIIK